MKSAIAIAAASAAAVSAVATPAKVEARADSTSSGGLPQVSVKGNAFWAGDKRFYIRGIDYQPGGSSDAKDPIADVDGCKRDVEEFKKLGINTIRVYTVDNTADHDECMSALSDAGIYLALDVNTPKYSLNRGDPGPSYNKDYLQSLFATVDAFANYDNTLLFFSGNEVINDDKTTNCAPYVKAVTRDLRQYIGTRGYRKIPVGYSAADVESNRFEMAQYMNCGTDDQRSDFYAFNDYSWCDPSSFQKSGWDKKVKQYGDYSIPLFLSEYGCNTNKRTFGAVKSIYDQDMSSVYSGGLVYEYSEEDSGYGLVKIDGDSVTENDDFKALAQQYKDNPAPEGDGGYKSDGKASPCPSNSDSWEVKDFKDDELPALPDGAQKFLDEGAGKGPGLKGSGSQNAGGGSTSTAEPGSGSVTSVASNTATAGSGSGSGSSGAADAASSSGAAGSIFKGEMGMAPFVCTAVVLLSSIFGAALI